MPKHALRQRIRELLGSIPSDVLSARSAAVGRLLCAQPEYARADVLMIYLSLPYEVDTQPIAIQAWADAKRVVAPRVSWDQRRMLPIEITTLAGEFEEDELGIRAPISGPPVPIHEIDLVLVPGLGFDEHGNRLGRGRGFYDRFLKHAGFRAVTCGLGLEEQFVDTIPTEPNDVPMSMLVTDVSVRRFAGSPGAPGPAAPPPGRP